MAKQPCWRAASEVSGAEIHAVPPPFCAAFAAQWRGEARQFRISGEEVGLLGEVTRGAAVMTATTSPAPTAWPGSTLTSATVPAMSAAMLFSIFIASSTQTAWPTSTVSPTATSTFTIVPCIGTVTLPLPAPTAAPAAAGPLAAAAPRPAAPAPAATTAPAVSGTHTATLKRLPLTSTSTSRAHLRLGLVVAGAPARRGVDADRREVERVLDPLGRVLGGDEVGVLEDGDVGRDRGRRCPRSRTRASARSMRSMAVLAVGAPHDELADEVVVELADLVARLVAAVPPHAEARAAAIELGDACPATAGTAARRVLGVDPHLDGVAAQRRCRPGVNGSGSPDATRSCSRDEVDAR